MALNVLIVDDSSVVRTMIKKSLSMIGIEIGILAEADNGQSALEILASEWIDLVFLDIHMPQMNGVQLIEKISTENGIGGLVIIIVSSDHCKPRIEHLLHLGVRDYIVKPFRPERIRDAVACLMDKEKSNGTVRIK